MGEAFGNPWGTMNGLRIITSAVVGDAYEDWSGVRSPGRAKRRRAQGHPQRIVTRYRANGTYYHDKIRNSLIMHPDDEVRLRRTLAEKHP